MSALIIPCGYHAAYGVNEMITFYKEQKAGIEGEGAIWAEVLDAEYEVYLAEDDDAICKRCEMDIGECECWELDAIERMMREEW